MKKLMAVLLVSLLMLSLSLPAAAFIDDSQSAGNAPYKLSVYTIDYKSGDFSSLTANSRNYAKKNIVAAVVELTIPKGKPISKNDYALLTFGGDHVNLNLAGNYSKGKISPTASASVAASAKYTAEESLNDDEIVLHISSLQAGVTYKWLFFAKLTDADASLYAKLTNGVSPSMDFEENDKLAVTLGGIDYQIWKQVGGSKGDLNYVISIADSKSAYVGGYVYINVDQDHQTVGMEIMPKGKQRVSLGMTARGELAIRDPRRPARMMTSGQLYDAAMDIYSDVAVDAFKLDYMRMGSYLRDSYFEGLLSSYTLISRVNI